MAQNLSARVASLQDLGIAAYLSPRYRLRSGPILDPRWLVRYGRGFFDCSVDTTGAIALGSEKLVPEESRPFQPGERVVVFCDRWFYGVRFSDAVCRQEVLERERTQRLKDEESSWDRRMADAKDFNGRICIPVKWDVAIRDVLSGLKENSIGDGRNAATVEHILLLEPLACGRLQRGKAISFAPVTANLTARIGAASARSGGLVPKGNNTSRRSPVNAASASRKDGSVRTQDNIYWGV